MKKIVILFLVFVVITLLFIPKTKEETMESVALKEEDTELRAIYVSYIELSEYIEEKDEQTAKANIDHMIDVVSETNFNTIILHVRPFSDAIYPSKIFPYSHLLTGIEGEDPGYDILEYILTKAHEKKISIHAWINPYRVRNTTDTEVLSSENPAVKWLGTDNVQVIEGKGIFYNPASKEVQDLIVNGVEELVQNYDVDGIQFDDYFYPSDDIDLEDFKAYKEAGGIEDIAHFRFDQVNTMVKRVYDVIKKQNQQVLFGIAPEGNMANNYASNYADTLTWMKTCGYIDYIMPQIYFGFENKNRPYAETIKEWNEAITCSNVKLIPALAFYKAGSLDEYALTGAEEWIEHQDIIMRQVLLATGMSHYQGFSLFRYDNVFSEEAAFQEEFSNLQSLLE